MISSTLKKNPKCLRLAPEEIVSMVLAVTDIEKIVSSYLLLKPAGRYYKALCPFHTEKTPSFIVNPERQIFHCFGCGEGGDVIYFIQKYKAMNFYEALGFLINYIRLDLAFNLDNGRAVSVYK